MTEDTNEMPKLLANWLLTAKTYDTDTDDDSTVASDVECPFDVRVYTLWISLSFLGCCVLLKFHTEEYVITGLSPLK